jgi:hypothetical protein
MSRWHEHIDPIEREEPATARVPIKDRAYEATEAESARLSRLTSRHLGKSGEDFNCVFSMSTKWLSSTGSDAKILNLTLSCDHFSPHDPKGRHQDRVYKATEIKSYITIFSKR